MAAGISFFMVSTSDLKYKLMRHVTFNPLLFWIASGLISCIFIWNKKNSVWYNFYQGTSVSITFYIFEHYQLWMMDSKAQRVFFPKTPKLCVWHTEVRSCYHFKLVSHFQLWFPIWGAVVNRLMSEISIWPLVGNHRGQTFLVVDHQVCTHLRRDFVPLLFADPLQVKISRLTFGNSNL